MKRIILFLFIFVSLAAQDKYLIYFKDKGITKEDFAVNKSLYKFSELNLSQKAIERRTKTLGDEYIKFIDLPIAENYVQAIQRLDVKIINKLKWFNAVSVYLTRDEINRISQLDFVAKIEKVKTLRFIKQNQKSILESISKTSTLYNFSYGNSFDQNELHDIPIVHDAGFSGNDVIIGFLDSGFDWKEHPALSDLKVLYEYDYVQNDNETKDQQGDVNGQDAHGTAVFSIATGFEEGELIGPSYESSFFLAKTENIASETRIEEDNFAAAVEDFESMGADIITASLGYSVFDSEENSYTYEDMDGSTTLVAQAYNYAFDLGVVTVAAAGNEGQSSWHYIISPADAFNVIAVGNVNKKGIRNLSSSYGPTADGRIKPEIMAMGTNNYHASSSNGYSSAGSGTSFSAPMVAGMIGQLLSAYPHLTNEQVRNIVLHSGDNFADPNNEIGYGLMSIKRAMNFPNVWEYESGKFRINRMLLNYDEVAEVLLNFKINDGDWAVESLTKNEDGIFSFEVPNNALATDDITFYYTLYDSTGIEIREPADKNYKVNLSENKVDFTTGITEFPDKLVNKFQLLQNYPNPFNPTTTIEFKSPESAIAVIAIYNSLGQKIKDLYTGKVVRGKTRLTWDGTDNSNIRVTSGAYFYSATINGKTISKKMVLLK